MFSELPHFPRAAVRLDAREARMPTNLPLDPAGHDSLVAEAVAASAGKKKEEPEVLVSGANRFKYFRRPHVTKLEGTVVL
jgi:hypothetical protein